MQLQVFCLSQMMKISDIWLHSDSEWWLNWLQQVESSRSSWVLDSSRLDLNQNFEIEYLSWVMMFELSIWVKLECWNQVLTWIFDSTRQDMKQSTTNIYLSVW